jgi:hypothetical protein
MENSKPYTISNNYFVLLYKSNIYKQHTIGLYQILKVLAVFLTIVGLRRFRYGIFNTEKVLLLDVFFTGLLNSGSYFRRVHKIANSFVMLNSPSICLSSWNNLAGI